MSWTTPDYTVALAEYKGFFLLRKRTICYRGRGWMPGWQLRGQGGKFGEALRLATLAQGKLISRQGSSNSQTAYDIFLRRGRKL
jgi:hypothetical protein